MKRRELENALRNLLFLDNAGFFRILVLNLIPCKQSIKSWYVINYILLLLLLLLLEAKELLCIGDDNYKYRIKGICSKKSH